MTLYFFNREFLSSKYQVERSITIKRAFLLGAGGFLTVTGSNYYGYPGAGPLACIISSFVASTGWKWRAQKHQNHDDPVAATAESSEVHRKSKENPVEHVFEYIWYGLQPILFASIGTEIKFELLRGDDVIIRGLIVLFVGLIVNTRPVQ